MQSGDYHSCGNSQGLASYIAAVRKFPYLSLEEEQDLACRIRSSGDKAAEACLVETHLRLVVKLARKYSHFGMPIADLIAEGNIGLLRAVQRFDPNLRCRFATYAAWWIRASIQDYILRNWSLVRLGTTAMQRKLFFSLERAKRQKGILEIGSLGDDKAAQIGSELQVDQEQVTSMNQRLAGDVSLNREIAGTDRERIDMLKDDRPDPEAEMARSESTKLVRRGLRRAMQNLNARERRILEDRRLRDVPRTLVDLSRELGISSERVRQIEHHALAKLRVAMMKSSLATTRIAA